MDEKQRQEKITLKTSLLTMKGVGPERHKLLLQLDLRTLEDGLYFFPRRYEDRQAIKTIRDLTLGDKECVMGTVISRGILRTRFGQTIFRLVLSDGKNTLFASWFNQPYLVRVFLPKARVILYGKAEQSGKHIQMFQPEYEILPSGQEPPTMHSGRIVPIYPLTEDLTQKSIRQLIYSIGEKVLALVKDPLPVILRKRMNLRERAEALRQIHFPDNFDSQKKAYERLVFDEFFAMQVLIQRKRSRMKKKNSAIVHQGGDEAVSEWIASLDFKLTAGQSAAIKDILADMQKDRPMARLVQGEVGSGKTAVAAAALLFTAANGFQGALMAPTEVLAQQHYFNLARYLEPLGIVCGFLAQGMPEEERQKTLEGISSGQIQLAIGTHALIQENVRFKNLGLTVIDEQHKFGVMQRAALVKKSHFLLMTATPIPRTLALTLYGDLDISTIAELPGERKPIRTLWVGEPGRQAVYQFLDGLIGQGRQGYVICPSVDGLASMKSVLATHQELSQVFAARRVDFLHGKMKSAEKKKIMQEFKEGSTQLLVSTVVIEVGVDVPNASMMIVENAERFGLAQLHQLRGRVGRGPWDSFCVLFSVSTDPEALERLSSFEKTKSGFEIAEKDLALRGAGDLIGRKQHGLPELRIGDLVRDAEILNRAKEAAVELIQKDPELEKSEHRLLKNEIQKRFGVQNEKCAVTA